MPYVISGNLDDNRHVVTVRTLEFSKAFYHPLARGEPLTPELLSLKPDPYLVEGPSRGDMPEVFGQNLGVWTLKDNVKQIIEGLEPGVHMFIPVNLRVVGSDKDWGRYYLLYPGQAIDAVIIDETDFSEGRGRSGFAKSHTLSSFGQTVLNAGMIVGRHLWRGARGRLGQSVPFYRYLFCSDELARRIMDAGVEGWRFRRVKLKPGVTA